MTTTAFDPQGLRSCPICARPLTAEPPGTRFRPFCSKRCADVDLGRWLREVYRIPAEDAPDVDELSDGEGGEDPFSGGR